MDLPHVVHLAQTREVDPLAFPLVFRSVVEHDLSDAHAKGRHCKISGLSQLAIGVYSGRKDLAEALRESCPGVTFLDEGPDRDACRIAIFDDDSHDQLEISLRKS